MKRQQRSYTNEFKSDAVNLALEIGVTKAAKELKMPIVTLSSWKVKHEKGKLVLDAPHTPKNASKLSDEVNTLRKETEELKRKIARLEEENEILDKAARFFAHRQKK